jgi:predicted O-methyltransferase YrrM
MKRNDDVFLCEALRQQGWDMKDIGPLGVDINSEPRRGVGEDPVTMVQQMASAQLEPDLSGWFFPEEATIYQQLASRVQAGTVVEIGVWKGRSISNILDICRANRNRLVAIDTWQLADDDPDFLEARSRDIRQVFIENLRILGHLDTVEILREDSAQAATHFDDGSVDLLFLDADHSYEAVKRDLCAWRPKMKPGGTLAGHDYIWKEGVRRAIHDVFGDHVALLGGSIWQAQDPQWSLGRGCIFIPTFCDTDLLDQNFGNRRDLTANLDIWVYDDNVNAQECEKVKALCQANGWEYRRSQRERHGSWRSEYSNLAGYNRFIWESMTFLGEHYDYVVKMDTDAYVIEPDWYREIAGLLSKRTAIAGTPETRPTRDVMSFWNLARKAGFDVDVGEYVTHLQGGLYGVSRAALEKLASMGFLAGEHVGFAEDCYMSYSARLLGIEFLTTQTTGSWFRPYRPKMELIRHLKAIHPLTRLEWEVFVRQSPEAAKSR